jgi:quercetin dioxygenase-like cupin family protein
LPHRHKTFYAFVSLRPVTLGNEVRGRQPVLKELRAGELHTSRGGFTVAERNLSPGPAEVLVIESIKADDGKSFSTPMGGFQLHDAALGELFESSVVRAYSMAFGAGGRAEKHREDYDRLLIALSDLSLHEEVDGQPPSDIEMKAGEVRWVARGAPHSTTNLGSSPAALLTLEFR